MPVVWIPALLRTMTAGQDRVPAAGRTLGEIVADLDARHPGLRERLCDGSNLRPGLAAVVDGAVARRGLDEPTCDASEIHFVPAIGGGGDATVERLADLANRFQDAWRANRDDPHAVVLDDFLPPAGDPLRGDALARLIPLDLAARWGNGVPLSLEDYIQKYPEIGPLDRVSPELIADEYRIRAEYGVLSPHSVLKQRFPKQFSEVEKLIQSDHSLVSAKTVVPARRTDAVVLEPGAVVGDHYRLNRLLGRGGFGEVWHATEIRGAIDKAIKILTRSADSEEAQKELESLNIIKKINHPYLLRTESYFVEKDRLFIVLELADATLRDVLKRTQSESRTGIRVEDLLVHMKHAALGLDFLHKQGILHRDVKPENILLVGDFGKVADFGLAKEAHNKRSTQADFAGTVVYSAPETWDGRVSTRSDQYSLAATYFELRTGRILFGGKTFQEVFLKHMEANPSLEPLPDLEQEVVRRALAKRPEDRYATCAEFVEALESAVLASGSKVIASQAPHPPARSTVKQRGKTTVDADSTGTAPPAAGKWNESAKRRPPRSWSPAAVVVPSLVAALLVGGYIAYDRLRPPEPRLASAPDQPKPPPSPTEVPPTTPVEPNPPKVEDLKPKPPEQKVPEEKRPEPKPPEPPPPSPSRRKLDEAVALCDAKKISESRDLIRQLDVAGETDTAIKRDVLTLYARLLNEGAFSRAELRTVDEAIADDPAVKPAFAAAMTRRLADDGIAWPDNNDEWKDRLRDCDRADPKSPLIQAIRAEATLESGGRVERLPLASVDESPFAGYVRARVAASQMDYPSAADLVAKLPADAAWFAVPRRARAALILETAAARTTPDVDGRPRLFASPLDADRAYLWRKAAAKLLGDRPLDKGDRLRSALAAAWKSDPDFAECKLLGDALVAKGEIDEASGLIELALSHPAGFAKVLTRVRPKMTEADVDAALRLAEAAAKDARDNPAIRSRHALLWYAKARTLERDGKLDQALEADDAALKIEPDNAAYRIAVARDRTLEALARAGNEPEAAARIKECERGLVASDDAARIDPTAGELGPDLGRVRALLYLEIGRTSQPWTEPPARMAFRQAVATGTMALAAAKAADRPGVALALAQAHEALGYLGRVDVDANFEEAARLYEDAVRSEPRHALQRGRCLYRWAIDTDLKDAKAKKGALLGSAVEEFEKLQKIADFSGAAEAGYWEALSHWDRANRLTASPKAQKAFERSLAAAAKAPAVGGVWAAYALNGLVEMTALQAKNSPELSAGWLASVEPAWRTLKRDPAIGGDEAFLAASAAYRDLFARASADTAAQYLKLKKLDKYRLHMDRAVDLEHSTEHAAFAVQRAIALKKNEALAGLTPQQMSTARQIAAAATLLVAEPARRDALRKELDAAWPQ